MKPIQIKVTEKKFLKIKWDDYSEFDFAKDHIPELIRLGTDRHLLVDVEDVDEDEMWAPMHAWRRRALP